MARLLWSLMVLSLHLSFNIVHANDNQIQIEDTEFQRLLAEDRVGLVLKNAPVWFFGQSSNVPPCIPTWAYSGSPSSPDIYDAAHRTPGGARCDFNSESKPPAGVGCNCRNPDIGIGNPAPPFPVYFTINQCSPTEVRITYNLFYEKDGFLIVSPPPVPQVDTGHDWDWERAVVVFTKNPGQVPENIPPFWQATNLLLGAHAAYDNIPWDQIQNTLSTDQTQDTTNLRLPQGQQGYDHPKVYAAWAKHSNFDTKNTFWNAPLYQLKSWAFRSDDWWGVVAAQNYIEANDTTPAGQVMQGQGWGHADSTPPRVQKMICGVSLEVKESVDYLTVAWENSQPGRRRRVRK